MRIYYKKKFWAGVGALLLGLALPGTCLFVGWERFDLKDAVLTTFMVLSGISGILRSLDREKARQEQERAIRGGDYAASGHVVLDREGLPYSPNALSLAFTRFVRKNHLPRLTLHGLRHTFATIASAQGVPLFDIGKAMGHSTPATTGRIYTHLVDRTHEETLLLVSAALK